MYCLIRFSITQVPLSTYIGTVAAQQVPFLNSYEIVRVDPNGVNKFQLVRLTRQLVRLQRTFRWNQAARRILTSPRTLARRELGYPLPPLPRHPETLVRGTWDRFVPRRRSSRTVCRREDRLPPTSGGSAAR